MSFQTTFEDAIDCVGITLAMDIFLTVDTIMSLYKLENKLPFFVVVLTSKIRVSSLRPIMNSCGNIPVVAKNVL